MAVLITDADTHERVDQFGTTIPAAERQSANSATEKLAVATKALTQLRAENIQLRADNAAGAR